MPMAPPTTASVGDQRRRAIHKAVVNLITPIRLRRALLTERMADPGEEWAVVNERCNALRFCHRPFQGTEEYHQETLCATPCLLRILVGMSGFNLGPGLIGLIVLDLSVFRRTAIASRSFGSSCRRRPRRFQG